ncbi:MAG: hypothetical protein RJB13_155 [Pseudomonadota bacterium]|jgi:hypothetical protein
MLRNSLVTIAVSAVGVSSAFAAPCNEGPNQGRRLIKSCSIESVENEVSGEKLSNISICLSSLQKEGGRFGGDRITWFLSSFDMTRESGETESIQFDTPDGRHNFRSPIDYAVTEFSNNFFYMESHRTKYADGSRKGTIEWHMVDFDTSSGSITFEHRQKSGTMLGRWADKIKFSAVCQ